MGNLSGLLVRQNRPSLSSLFLVSFFFSIFLTISSLPILSADKCSQAKKKRTSVVVGRNLRQILKTIFKSLISKPLVAENSEEAISVVSISEKSHSFSCLPNNRFFFFLFFANIPSHFVCGVNEINSFVLHFHNIVKLYSRTFNKYRKTQLKCSR